MNNQSYYKSWRHLSGFAAYKVRKSVFNLFLKLIVPDKNATVLDVGVTGDVVNKGDNYFEKFYPWKSKITALGIEDASYLEKEYPGVKFVMADAKRIPFEDGFFDIVFSSSTLEHVGSRDNQREVISEILRVGKKVFITTPNRFFPIEVHTGLPFLQFLPAKTYRKILKVLGLNFFSKEENLNLLDKKELRELFPTDSVRILQKFNLLIAIKK